MALDTVPWFVGGGAEHSPSVARMLAYAATNGATGVISPEDLKVTALPTPGTAVRIMPGGAALLNRYPGATNQSYTVRNATATDVEVTATGSSGGATRYLLLRVDDPEFGGQAPANPRTGPYVRPVLVSSITNLAYPFVALAKIVQPANTATITQAMITDLREVANPRARRDVLSAASTALTLTSTTTAQVWPSVRPSIAIPEWANWVNVIYHVSAFTQRGGAADAELRVYMGETPIGGAVLLDLDAVGDGVRQTTFVTGSGTIPANLRGTNVLFGVKGIRLAVANHPGIFGADGSTHVAVDCQFEERAS